jgi:serine/threonine protein kinase/Flp pilus assembly protein TadD
MLVERRGKIVTREEIKKKLWPNDTVVDFDHSINTAIKTLRRALSDSADDPQYIETLARRGYRLRIAVEWLESAAVNRPEPPASQSPPQTAFPTNGGLIGTRVSHYRVLEVIGGGGMGMVYKAEDLKLGRPVALKFLPEDLTSDPVALKRFEREAQTASALNHPNICTIHEIEEYDGRPFIAMELLEGTTLRDRMAASESKAIPTAELLEIAMQICEGLQAAHAKGIVHRDVKPANIFLTKQGAVKILDFGLAKLAASQEVADKQPLETSPGTIPSPPNDPSMGADQIHASLTRPGTTAGTAGYMSPEQVRREKLDGRSDLFSCGLVLYEMAAGKRPFEGETAAVIHDAILHRTPIALHDLNPAVPRGLEDVVAKALEKDRDRRYQSAAEIHADLAHVQKEMQPARRYLRIGLQAAALLLIAATGLWYYINYRNRITLSDTDTVVVGEVDNRTAEPVLADALTVGLQYGLGQTPYLNILSTDKIFGTLASLKLPPTTKLTPDIARKVCLATNSKMVLASSIADAGNRYRMELSAIECASGKTVERVSSDAASRAEIIHQLGVAEAQLRKKLGEPAASLARFNKPLEEATSASPEALQAGLTGYKHHLLGDFAGAVSNYQRAIELDPNLALAQEALGAAASELGQPELRKSACTKAYELRSRMTEPNRLNVEYLYYDTVTGEQEKALVVESELAQMFPRDFMAHVNLAKTLGNLGQPDRAAYEAREAARLFPNAVSYFNWILASIYANRVNEAQAALDQANAQHFDNTGLRRVRMQLAFLKGDNAALEEIWKWAAGKPGLDGAFLYERSLVEAYYGHFHTARRWRQEAMKLASKGQTETFSDVGLTWASYEANLGNSALTKKDGEESLKNAHDRKTQLIISLALAQAGDTQAAQKLVDTFDQQYPLGTLMQNFYLPTIRAAMKLNANDPAGAVEILRPAVKYELSIGDGLNSVDSAYIRGLAYLQMGDGRHAAPEFQKVIDHRGIVARSPTGPLAYLHLGRAQKMVGDEAAARKSYEEFLTIWKYADPDIPILKQAQAEYAKLQQFSAKVHPAEPVP